MSDRNPLPNSKRAGIYFMVNLLLHFSIETGTTGPMTGLVRNIKTSGPSLDIFPISDQVSFHYWLGRHNLNRHQIRSYDMLIY
ncbi:hypothetical protein AYI69_g450 [Smittium culicis]|uniref:Uncharacterized protein n=1 Tax=Smittium culicis TaxID=133412 RepID=A0A1R1YSZ5_9FUNG|nr:hypothetical protein AYI69_g450 [Smittium culicis]